MRRFIRDHTNTIGDEQGGRLERPLKIHSRSSPPLDRQADDKQLVISKIRCIVPIFSWKPEVHPFTTQTTSRWRDGRSPATLSRYRSYPHVAGRGQVVPTCTEVCSESPQKSPTVNHYMHTQTFSKFVRPEEVAGGRITDRDLDIIESILRYRFIPRRSWCAALYQMPAATRT